MKYLLDTNVCISYLRGRALTIRKKLSSLATSDIYLCSIVIMELYGGALRSDRSDDNISKITEFTKPYTSLEFDDVAAMLCAKIRLELEQKGQPIGPFDLQIAAIAMANDFILVTHNTQEFSRIVNIKLEDWEST